MKKDKTFLEYYNTLEEPYGTEAIDNAIEQGCDLELPCSSLKEALFTGFAWAAAPQGADYWITLLAKLKLDK